MSEGTGNEQPFSVEASDQETAGDMGVSSETEGATGPGQHGTTGTRDVSPRDADADAADGETPPEQSEKSSAGEREVHPDPPIPPKSGYNSRDPRSKDKPFKPGPQDLTEG